jgi:adenylate cyclase
VSAAEIDFDAEGLLDGLEGQLRADRIALLQRLASRGVPLAELRRATASGTIMYLLADPILASPTRYTVAEVAQASGIEEGFLTELRRAMGLPVPEGDEAIYTEGELESAQMVGYARAAGISDDELLDLMRVLGRSLAQVAEALRAMPLRLVLAPGMSEPELAAAYAEAAGQMYPLVNPLVSNVLTLHLRNATQSTMVSELERMGGQLPGARPVTVGFADLVGFTRLGEEVPPDELSALAVRLEAIATEVVSPPVRLVKTIGDAAMLASPEPDSLLAATLDLLAAADAEGEDFPQLRAGAATGEGVLRAGDWFGRPVNLASRITAIARPGSLLATGEVHEAAGDGFNWSFAGERRIRGVRSPVALYRVRAAAATSA